MYIKKDNIFFQIDRAAKFLSRLTKIILTFSSTTLFLSTIVYIIYKQKCWTPDSLPGAFIWYSTIVCLYSLFYGLITIIILSIYYRSKRQKIWLSIKKEIILLILTIILFGILALTIYIINTLKPEQDLTVCGLHERHSFCIANA